MEENQKKPERYPLPFIIHTSYKFGIHVSYLFITIMFIECSFIPISNLIGIIYRLLNLALGLFFIYIWVYMGVMKKGYIELTEEEILYKTIFRFKRIKWTDIADIQTYYRSNNSFIGVISKAKLEKRKDTFLTLISDLNGGEYFLSIPLRAFSTAEPEKLYSTIIYNVQEKYQKDCN